jgi:hypothetical protein
MRRFWVGVAVAVIAVAAVVLGVFFWPSHARRASTTTTVAQATTTTVAPNSTTPIGKIVPAHIMIERFHVSPKRVGPNVHQLTTSYLVTGAISCMLTLTIPQTVSSPESFTRTVLPCAKMTTTRSALLRVPANTTDGLISELVTLSATAKAGKSMIRSTSITVAGALKASSIWWLHVQSRVEVIRADYAVAEAEWQQWTAKGSNVDNQATVSAALSQLSGAEHTVGADARAATPAEVRALNALTSACDVLGEESSDLSRVTSAQFENVGQALEELQRSTGTN